MTPSKEALGTTFQGGPSSPWLRALAIHRSEQEPPSDRRVVGLQVHTEALKEHEGKTEGRGRGPMGWTLGPQPASQGRSPGRRMGSCPIGPPPRPVGSGVQGCPGRKGRVSPARIRSVPSAPQPSGEMAVCVRGTPASGRKARGTAEPTRRPRPWAPSPPRWFLSGSRSWKTVDPGPGRLSAGRVWTWELPTPRPRPVPGPPPPPGGEAPAFPRGACSGRLGRPSRMSNFQAP